MDGMEIPGTEKMVGVTQDEYDRLRSLQEELQQKVNASASERDAMRSLLASSGWQMFQKFMSDQVAIRRETYENAEPTNEEDRAALERVRIEISVLKTLLDYPQAVLDYAENSIRGFAAKMGELASDNGSEDEPYSELHGEVKEQYDG